MLTDDELIELIDGHESYRTELTESGNKSNMEKCRKAICALANDLPNHKKPGVLFVGLRDDRTCADLRITTELLEKLANLGTDGKISPPPIIEVERRNLRGCEVAVIQVAPSDSPPIRVGGNVWVRVGPTQQKATAEHLRLLTEKQRWGNLPYDMRGVDGASAEEDLDIGRFQSEYLPNAMSAKTLAKNHRTTHEQLQALRLATRDGTPTVAAILLFGKDPVQWFPSAYVQFVRFDGNEVTDPIADQKEIHGTLPGQLLELENLLKVHVRTPLDMSGTVHVENPEYPVRALRELTHNAVIHRNYESSSAPVHIRWFSDNIEIVSPGSVHGELSPEKFGEPGGGIAHRNPAIAEAMKRLGFMERFGVGISIARDELRNNGNPEPEFRAENNFAFVKVKKRV
ncbi:MAG: putative DNA binding domain-containing protein [Alphaproteobacteria bacterium]|nr:putative DNA binding domain-containing protein [Gammaproteobacteria bacterium]MDA8030341.1 putative DNA binding domain-containing protein [Alphaproteobacteria bacterium]